MGTLRCHAQALVPTTRSGPAATTPMGLAPADVWAAYNLNPAAGAGQTVAVVEGYRYGGSDPNTSPVEADLATYRSQFGLAACTRASGCLVELNQDGQPSPLPLDGPNSAVANQTRVETMLDTEAVSATCPQCRIVVVYANDFFAANVFAAVDAARSRANEVSISLGEVESDFTPATEQGLDRLHLANSRGVAIVAAAGDCGYGTEYPAASPFVTAAGGTALARDSSARGWSESVWNSGPRTNTSDCPGYPGTGQGLGLIATGGGCTQEARPAYQPRITGCGNRIANDISAAADPSHGGLATFNIVDQWTQIGGTSESAPIIAATYALGGGEGYAVGPQPLYTRASTFDITTGGNVNATDDCGTTLCNAAPGFDGPSGLGSPNGPFTPVPTPPAGYWLVASDGGIFPFGLAAGFGSTGGIHLNKPIVGMARTADGRGYWLVASDGGIFPFGDAAGFGSTGGIHLNSPIVGMAAAPDGRGYWLVAADGGIFPFGKSAGGYGSTGGIHLNRPIVGMASTPTGKGYWLVASDGGIFPFGDAVGYGSTGGIRLNRPIVGMSATPSGHGYWLVARDGGIFPFGDAVGYGSTGGIHLNQPIVGMTATAAGHGYWLVASDGGIFPFGDALGLGSLGGQHLNNPVVGMAS